MHQYIDAIDEYDTMSKEAAVLRMMMADSFEVKFDNEGRINIPEALISFANLDNTAVFMGVGRSFMIWSILDYQVQYENTQKILQSNGPPEFILKKKRKHFNE